MKDIIGLLLYIFIAMSANLIDYVTNFSVINKSLVCTKLHDLRYKLTIE